MEGWQRLEPDASDSMRIAVIGEAVDNSPIPAMIDAGFVSCGLSARCLPLAVPQPEFEPCVRRLAEIKFRGAYMLAPYKSLASRLAEKFYTVRHSVGVANALTFQGGIFGQNTEVPAFQNVVRRDTPETALVLGSGPAARMVVVGLLMDGWRVRLWARSLAKSRVLATALAAFGEVELVPTADPGHARLIVNASPVGHRPGETLPIVWQNVRPHSTAVELVERRVPTPFLREAALRGFQTIEARVVTAEAVGLAIEWWTEGMRLDGQHVPKPDRADILAAN